MFADIYAQVNQPRENFVAGVIPMLYSLASKTGVLVDASLQPSQDWLLMVSTQIDHLVRASHAAQRIEADPYDLLQDGYYRLLTSLGVNGSRDIEEMLSDAIITEDHEDETVHYLSAFVEGRTAVQIKLIINERGSSVEEICILSPEGYEVGYSSLSNKAYLINYDNPELATDPTPYVRSQADFTMTEVDLDGDKVPRLYKGFSVKKGRNVYEAIIPLDEGINGRLRKYRQREDETTFIGELQYEVEDGIILLTKMDIEEDDRTTITRVFRTPLPELLTKDNLVEVFNNALKTLSKADEPYETYEVKFDAFGKVESTAYKINPKNGYSIYVDFIKKTVRFGVSGQEYRISNIHEDLETGEMIVNAGNYKISINADGEIEGFTYIDRRTAC